MKDRRVLLVEDNDDIRENLSEILEDEGYEVIAAENGQVALDLLERTTPPSVIVLDLMMPIMNGWQLRSALLERPAFAKLPVILLSARTDVNTTAKALGVVAGLRKPISLPNLLQLVKNVCG
ncbi:MAG: response regulator [Haliangiales bacterium]